MESISFLPEQLWNNKFRFLKLRAKGKVPIADSLRWQETNFQWNDEGFMTHVSNGGNYGVIGGFGNLVIIDADSPEINNICKTLPKTLTIKTGNPVEYKYHYYFIADKVVKPIRFSRKKLGDLGDVRSKGQYVVGPNSIHPKGGVYKVENDISITSISEEHIRGAFKDFINPESNTEFKEYEISTRLRNSRFIRECRVPDFALNNKMKGGTSKNWELFPYLVDILHNREVKQQVYQKLVRTQGHPDGSIKGWVMKAHEGKLAKTSCKKMREHLETFHEDLIPETCKKCPLYKKIELKKNIEENKDLTDLQKQVLLNLAAGKRDIASEMIVKEIKKNNFVYTTKDDLKSEVWIYDEGIYVPNGKSTIKEFCRKILDEAYTTTLANLVIAKIETDTYIDQDKFFDTNYIYEVPLLNGILDIRTKEVSEFDPSKIFFNKLPIEFDPSTECPNILKHFENILKDENDVKLMVEIFGYLLLKEYRIEKAFMFVGNGRNGKSKTIELMKRFLGPSNCSALALRTLNDESFSLHELFGRMANLAPDLSKTDLKETGMIKSLIGRDFVQAKRKFLRDLNFVNYAKMVFGANELPKIYDATDGFWTKWVLIDFPYKFVSKQRFDSVKDKKNLKIMDQEIVSKLTTKEELSGLLNLALQSLDIILEKRDFSYSKSSKEVRNMWVRKSDSFTAFCFDYVEEDLDSKVSKKDLRRGFYNYCKKHKLSGASDKAIRVVLENMFGVSESQDSMDFGKRFWDGIKLKEEILGKI